MNIFATDPDPVVCARHHCDIHLRKMIVEVCQLLSTAHVVCDGVQVAYKKTHHNHPCSLWVRESASNYRWTHALLEAMLDEYAYRFNKQHLSGIHLATLRQVPTMPDQGLTSFAQAMPEHLRSDNPHKSYRAYLKSKFEEWTERERPVKCVYTNREIPRFAITVARRIHTAIILPCKREVRHAPCI